MIGCLRTRVRKQPIIALYFESENELKFYNLEARSQMSDFVPQDYFCFGVFFETTENIRLCDFIVTAL